MVFHEKKDENMAQEKYQILSLQRYFGEGTFAQVFAAWDKRGIHYHFSVEKETDLSIDNDPRKGDSIELFFNTRPSDSRTFLTQFCHHFVLTPVEMRGTLFREVTKFRTEETHPFVTQQDVSVSSHLDTDRYLIDCILPFSVFHGYEKKKPLTFFYRINRKESSPQSLSASHQEYEPQKTPLLWTKVSFE